MRSAGGTARATMWDGLAQAGGMLGAEASGDAN